MAAAMDAVIFDLDGTLLDTETLSDQAMLQALAPPNSTMDLINHTFPQSLKLQTLGLRSSSWAPLVLNHFAPLFPASAPLSLTSSQLIETWEKNLLSLSLTAKALPGALQLVQTLHACKIPIAIATSSTKHAVEYKARSNPALFAAFATIVTGDHPSVQSGKPAPDIFLEAARQLSTPATSCVVIEDSLAGCQAGKAAGCYVIAVPDPTTPASAMFEMSSVADMIMPSLLDFDGSLFNLPSPPPLKPHWLDTTNVDRQDLSTLSTEDFIERYEKTGVPCILTGVVPTWKASTAWTRKSLLSRFPDTLFRVSATRDMALSDYFLYCDEQNAKKPSERDARPLYLFQKDFPKVVPEMADEYCIPPYFADDLMGAIPAESRPDYRWLIIGPALSGSSFHVDPNANFAWNATIQGRKKWIFYPPGCPPPKSECDSRQVDLVQWFDEFYDNDASKHLRMECVTAPGECMYVPQGWWHSVLNLDLAIAITHNVVTGRNLLPALEFLEDKASCAQGEGCRGNVKFDLAGDVPTSVIYPYKEAVEEAPAAAVAAAAAGGSSAEADSGVCECGLRTRAMCELFLAGMDQKHPGLIEKARAAKAKTRRVVVEKRLKGEEEGEGFSFGFL